MLGIRKLGLRRRTSGAAAPSGLLGQYPGAAAAYSLRELSAAWAGQPVVRVRRESDDAEMDFTAAEIEDGTLVNWVFGVTDETLPADYGSGAAAAYSLRYVSSGYSGPVVRVRRDSDNAEMDFNPTEVEDGTLVTWVGVGNNGLVTTWYDQSGNVRNALQGTATSQPLIVDSGDLVNGMFFDLGDRIQASFSYTSPQHIFSVSNQPTTGTTTRIVYDGYDGLGFFYYNISNYTAATSSGVDNFGSDEAGMKLISHKIQSGSNDLYKDAALQYSNASTGSRNMGGVTIGDIRGAGSPLAGGYNWEGEIQEVILYDSDQSANREAIEKNTNRHYGIYDANAYVVTWYDQSGGGFDLNQSTNINQPAIVLDGQLVAENGEAALNFDGMNDYLHSGSFTISSYPYSIFCVVKDNDFGGANYIFDSTSRNTLTKDGFAFTGTGTLKITGSSGNGAGETVLMPTGRHLISAQNGLVAYIYRNGVMTASGSGSFVGSSDLFVGAIFLLNSSKFWDGTMQELIFYPNSQSANREAIEANMNEKYNVY